LNGKLKTREISLKNENNLKDVQIKDVDTNYDSINARRKCIQTNLNKVNKLGDTGYNSGCVSMARYLCERKPFPLDCDHLLLGCNTGVVDLRVGKHRKTTPDDLIRMSTQITYRIPTEEELLDLELYLEELFPDKKRRQEVLEVVANCLDGSNRDKIVLLCQGKSDSGKTGFVKFLSLAIGDYAATIPREVIYTRRMQSNVARPELIRAINCRVGFVNETASNELMDVGILKQLSGNDKVFFRQLYGTGDEVRTTWTMFIVCNECPYIAPEEEAVWSRMKMIYFESKFTSDAPKTRQEQVEQKKFPRQTAQLDNRMKNLAPIMLYKLVEQYAVNKIIYEKTHGTPPMTILRRDILVYKQKNDPIVLFSKEYIVEAKDNKISCDYVYETYKMWYSKAFPKNKAKNKLQFIKEMSAVLEQPVEKCKYGRTEKECWNDISVSYNVMTEEV
jgi:putative DNA primase/helicase